jgi:hypothetical protein
VLERVGCFGDMSDKGNNMRMHQWIPGDYGWMDGWTIKARRAGAQTRGRAWGVCSRYLQRKIGAHVRKTNP